MARIKQTISPAPGILVPIIAVIYKTTAPGTEVARHVIPTPHTSPYVYEFSDVDPGVYNVKHYTSSDGSTLETLTKDFFCDAVTNEVLYERLFYTVDGGDPVDPVSGTNYIEDTYLDGKTVTGVFQEGYRYLQDGVEWSQGVGGRINFLGSITNNSGQVWVVEVSYTGASTTVGVNDTFASIVAVTANVTLDSTYYNNTIMVAPTGNKQTTTLPLIGAVPNGKGFVIVHDKGNAPNVVVKAQTGEVIRWMGADKNQVILGIGEVIKIIKSGSKYYAQPIHGQWERVGEFIGWHTGTKTNGVALDSTEYDLTVYLRLKEFIDTLSPSQVVDYATYDSTVTINGETVKHKQGFFAVDTLNNKAKVPNLLNKHVRYLKNIGGADATRYDNVAGGYQHDAMRDHYHNGLEAENTSHGGSSSVQAGPNVKLLVNTIGGAVASISNGKTGPVYISGTAAGGSDTHGMNIGMVPILLI